MVQFTHVQSCNVTRVHSECILRCGTFLTHAQSCNVICVQSATEWTASVHTLHMFKPYNLCSKCYGMDCFWYMLYTCANLQCIPCSKWYGMYVVVQFTHVQTCNVIRVQSTTERILWFIFYIYPNLQQHLKSP